MPHGTMTTGTHPFAQLIRSRREVLGIGVNQLARSAGMSASYVSRIERAEEGELAVSEEKVRLLAAALDIDPLEALVTAGHILPSEMARIGRRESFESFIAKDRRLTAPQRQALIQVYRGFVGLDDDGLDGEESGA